MNKVKSPPNADIGKRISAVMRNHPVLCTQMALAQKTGIGQSTIGRILRGESDTSAENLKAIATALGTSVEFLMFGTQTAIKQTASADVPLVPMESVFLFWKSSGKEREAVMLRRIPCPGYHSSKTFAVIATGDAASPTIEHGEIIYIDAAAPATHGKLIAVLDADHCHITPKIMTVDGQKKLAKQISQDFPGKRYEEISEDRIVGVVIGKYAELST